MTMQSRIIAGLGVVLIVLGLVVLAFQRLGPPGAIKRVAAPHHTGGDEIAAGELAADFNLLDLAGNTVSLSSQRGKVVFLNVWATWCGPCREEMPAMEVLFNEFKSRKDFVMLAVSEDQRGHEVVGPYVAKNGYHFPILLDPENRIGQSYDVTGVPETFIIDRKGRIVAHHMGAFDWSRDDVRKLVEQMLQTEEG